MSKDIKYKNFIFDFGQVIVHFDETYMTSVYIEDNDEVEKVRSVVFDRLYWDRLDNGTITDDEVKAGIKSRLPEHIWEAACTVYDKWYYNLPFFDGMRELISKLKENGNKVFLLSNISQGFMEGYKSVPEIAELFDSFDGLVFSGPLGIVKPSADIFNFLLKTYSLKAEESLFIDDREINIKGAEAVGINGYLFDGNVEKLADYIKL